MEVKKIDFKVTALSPIHVGSDSVSTISLPYLLHLPQDDKKVVKVEPDKIKEFIRIVGSIYRNTKHESYGYRSFADIFRDRVFASLLANTISQFFTLLKTRVNVSSQDCYQYITKFALSLSKKENLALIQWARENIDIFVTSAIYCEDSTLFKEDFEISEDLCETELDITVPVIPGNSWRGKARRVLMYYVFNKLYGDGIKDKIKDKAYYTFFNGGMLTKADGYLDIAEKAEIREVLPFLSIFGAMLGKEDLPGKMNFNFALLDCLETEKNDRDGMSYLKEYFMTRRDDFEGMVEEGTKKTMSAAIQMYYSALCVETNATFSWSVVTKYFTELEKSFFDLMLIQLQKDGHIGGMNRAGYGKYKLDIIGDYKIEPEIAEKYLEENKEKLVEAIAKIGE